MYTVPGRCNNLEANAGRSPAVLLPKQRGIRIGIGRNYFCLNCMASKQRCGADKVGSRIWPRFCIHQEAAKRA